MSTEPDKSIVHLYGLAKAGRWDEVLSEMAKDLGFARRCSRFAKPSSGWTFLHQAAYFGHDRAARSLIGLGASLGASSTDGETSVGVARRRGHTELARALETAAATGDGLWAPSPLPDVLPSSSAFDEAEKRRALLELRVAYGEAIIVIPAGSRYYVDSFERILVGWHGSFDPPGGMGDDPKVSF